MANKILKKLGLVKISTIEKWLQECKDNHSSVENGSQKMTEHYYDSGACSVINFIKHKLNEV